MAAHSRNNSENRGMILFMVMVTALLLIGFVGALGVLSKRNLNDVVDQVDSKRAKHRCSDKG